MWVRDDRTPDQKLVDLHSTIAKRDADIKALQEVLHRDAVTIKELEKKVAELTSILREKP